MSELEDTEYIFDSSKKYRDWCFTWNNWTQANYDAVLDYPSDYLVIGKEVGDSGTPHLQGYFYCKSARYFSAIQKKLRGAHLKPRYPKSTPEKAATYCKKDGDFFERGTCPEQGKRNDVELVREQLQAGEGMRGVVRVATNLQSIKIAECILKYEEPKRDWKPHIVWYWGLTGCGKSREAHLQFADKDYFRKSSTTEKWFDGYDAHTHVIFDDFLFPENKKEYNYWLDVFDRYACVVQTKGGIRQFLAKEIIVTSSTNPVEALMGFNQAGAEFLRRIDSIYQFQENESPKLTLGKPI